MKQILIIVFIFSSLSLVSQDKFGPWRSTIDVGDKSISSSKISKKKKSPVLNAPQGAAWLAIRLFQLIYSPQDGPNCRHKPTCSAYGKNAVSYYGALLGAFLAGDRIIRCNPFTPPSHDPVPKNIFKNKK